MLCDLEDLVAGLPDLLLDLELHRTAHHHRGQLGRGGGRAGLAHDLAPPDDGDPVGHGPDLAQLVGDEHDRRAGRLEVTHHPDEVVDLLRRQHGGGLVEDQDVGLPVERLEDLDALLLADADLLDDRHVAVVVADVNGAAIAHVLFLRLDPWLYPSPGAA
jgi:hypothetical protein